MHRQIVSLLFVITVLLTDLGTISASPSAVPENAINQASSHVIENISYIAQTERNYCYHTCLAMVLNYMGLNTTLDEVLFLGGIGYAHTYTSGTRLPQPFVYSREYLDFFGVQENSWDAGISDANWTEYCTRLDANITNDKPVLITVDPFSLPSLRSQYIVNDQTWSELFHPGIHVILIVGYDETNQSVCYLDPNAGYFGDSNYGDHAWMHLDQLRTAVERCIVEHYRLGNFTQVMPPLPRSQAAAIALQRNLEILNGTEIPYAGMNATRQLQLWYSSTNRSDTIDLYKDQGGLRQGVLLVRSLRFLCSVLRPSNPNVFGILGLAPHDPFMEIAAGKNHVADYLEDSLDLSWAENQSQLLRSEATSWSTLSSHYQVFLRHGHILLDLRAKAMMNSMEQVTQDILAQEQEILDSPI